MVTREWIRNKSEISLTWNFVQWGHFYIQNLLTGLLVITKPQNQFRDHFCKNCAVIQRIPLALTNCMLRQEDGQFSWRLDLLVLIILEDVTLSLYISHGSHSLPVVSPHPSSHWAGRTVLFFIFEGILRPLRCLPVTVTLSHQGLWLLHIQWFGFQHWVNRGCS